MKPVTITIPAELDDRAAAEARRLGISKSELFRRGLQAVLPPSSADAVGSDQDAAEAWRRLAGFGPPDVSIEPGEIDRVLYGNEVR